MIRTRKVILRAKTRVWPTSSRIKIRRRVVVAFHLVLASPDQLAVVAIPQCSVGRRRTPFTACSEVLTGLLEPQRDLIKVLLSPFSPRLWSS